MITWTASSEFGTYRLCEQRRFRRACASAHTSSESRGTFRQKARSLAPLNSWACAVEICHDGMLEDTNSLDGAHIMVHVPVWIVNMYMYATSTMESNNPNKTKLFLRDVIICSEIGLYVFICV